MLFRTSKRLSFAFITTLLLLIVGVNPIEARDNKGRFVVVIDAGHGGKDTGAIGKRSKEKNIVLDVALKVGAKIKAQNPNIVIYYTRDKDVFIGLQERAGFANRKKADLFVSIHANANKNRSPKGAETYVLGLHRTNDNLEVAMKEKVWGVNSSISSTSSLYTAISSLRKALSPDHRVRLRTVRGVGYRLDVEV